LSSNSLEALTREDVLDGLLGGHAKAASAALFAVESRTAHLVAQSRQAMERFLTEDAAEERELAFLEALALGRESPLRPTIQDLERHSAQWASLVPENPRVRATIAHMLGQKYEFTSGAVPGIRTSLGLDEKGVQQAYNHLYQRPLETIFATRIKPAERLRWAWATLDGWLVALPAFWTVFSLTLTETVSAGILALPIALAGVGPLPGVVLLVALGLVNMLTIAYMAESVSRSGTIRYGSAFIGRVVAEYLGRTGSFILSFGLITICFLALWAYYIGFSRTLADATRIPAPVWVALLFLVGLYYLRRDTLNATIVSALVIGAVNIVLILLISLLAFAHVRPANLFYVNVPFLGGRPFEPMILRLIFGVILSAYFGHLSLSNCARVVLHRDASARALISGAVMAQAVAMVIYCVWVLAVNGAIAPQALVGRSGTALAPLAEEVGPTVHVLGSVFVVLGMAMASIHTCLGLTNLVRERLPISPRPIMVLPRRRGRLLLHSSRHGTAIADGDLRLGLTYLGLAPDREPVRSVSAEYGRGAVSEHVRGNDHPHFRLDVQVHGDRCFREVAVTGSWDIGELCGWLPASLHAQHRPRLALEILDASQEHVRVRVNSPMHLTYEGEWHAAGLSLGDVLALPDSSQQVVSWMTRETVTGQETVSLADAVTHTGLSEANVRTLLYTLVEQGFVHEIEVDGTIRYCPQSVFRRGRPFSEEIRRSLGAERPILTAGGPQNRLWLRTSERLLGERGRFFLSISLVLVAFLLTEWALLTDRGSFSGPLSFLGVIVVSLLGGIFPVLLLVASRQKGEVVPSVVYRFLGHPLLTTGVFLLFLTSLFLHGLVIWADSVQRAAALGVAVLMIGATAVMARRGAFAPRVVVELREDQRGQRFRDKAGPAPSHTAPPTGRTTFAITVGGKQALADVRLGYEAGEQRVRAAAGEIRALHDLQYAIFQLPAAGARELKAWAHRITPEGNSEGLPALLIVQCDSERKEFDMKLSGGQVVLPLSDQVCRLEINLRDHYDGGQ
jgi:hypothetical protein